MAVSSFAPLNFWVTFLLQVFNFIPSISAITGVSPQRYFWRISIALHVGPRFIIAVCYKSYYEHMLSHVENLPVYNKAKMLMNFAFWLHVVEITSLCGVTYISNRENYSEYRTQTPNKSMKYKKYSNFPVFCFSSTRTSIHRIHGMFPVSHDGCYKIVSIIKR